MGAWGYLPFENDDALDWLDELEAKERKSSVGHLPSRAMVTSRLRRAALPSPPLASLQPARAARQGTSRRTSPLGGRPWGRTHRRGCRARPGSCRTGRGGEVRAGRAVGRRRRTRMARIPRRPLRASVRCPAVAYRGLLLLRAMTVADAETAGWLHAAILPCCPEEMQYLEGNCLKYFVLRNVCFRSRSSRRKSATCG